MELKLTPMYNLQAVMNTWHFIHEGLEAILEHAEEDTRYERIFVEIMDKTLLLWMAFLDGKYCGFFTTRLDQNAPITAKYLTVVHLYIKPGTPSEVLEDGFKQLQTMGKEQFNCKYIRFYSTRKGWERKLRDWKQGYIEYWKAI